MALCHHFIVYNWFCFWDLMIIPLWFYLLGLVIKVITQLWKISWHKMPSVNTTVTHVGPRCNSLHDCKVLLLKVPTCKLISYFIYSIYTLLAISRQMWLRWCHNYQQLYGPQTHLLGHRLQTLHPLGWTHELSATFISNECNYLLCNTFSPCAIFCTYVAFLYPAIHNAAVTATFPCCVINKGLSYLIFKLISLSCLPLLPQQPNWSPQTTFCLISSFFVTACACIGCQTAYEMV